MQSETEYPYLLISLSIISDNENIKIFRDIINFLVSCSTSD
jgi:hypothetical protein